MLKYAVYYDIIQIGFFTYIIALNRSQIKMDNTRGEDMTEKHADRHAYMIICHTNFDQLNLLLELLDDKRNDIYLHIDKKAKGYSIDTIRRHVHNAGLNVIKPMSVSWGGDTQIKVEISLLEAATKTTHQYYHLISGMDLPIKTQDEIHRFFADHSGTDFVALEKENPHNLNKDFLYRVDYYYLFQNLMKGNRDGRLAHLQMKHLRLQNKFRIRRSAKSGLDFVMGSNWFSITHRTAVYVLDAYRKHRRSFRFTCCADEVFLQTLIAKSPFCDSIEDDNLRMIDWFRGNPYTYRAEDFDSLIAAPPNRLFARKFDEKTDGDIIMKIHQHLLKNTDTLGG